MVKKKSRASASRAKGARKGAKKSAAKRRKTIRAGVPAAHGVREGLDVKKLKLDLQKAIDTLQRRIDKGDSALRLAETRDLFRDWVGGIEQTVCVDISGPCGEDMFIGS